MKTKTIEIIISEYKGELTAQIVYCFLDGEKELPAIRTSFKIIDKKEIVKYKKLLEEFNNKIKL
jgi:hypothetical protein